MRTAVCVISYMQILEHHTWMTSEHPTFVARLWDKIANLLTNADRYGGLAAIPGKCLSQPAERAHVVWLTAH